MGKKPSVVVIGGGLAGIAAAVRLAQQSVAVTLVETRQRLGGRATSFVDPATGQVLDNCQHVLLGCCTNLINLYRDLRVTDQIDWHHRLYFMDSRGVIDCLEADDLPAPLHLSRSLIAFRSFTAMEKLAIARGMLAMIRLGKAGREKLHHLTFAQWLNQQKQPASVTRKFWSVIVTSALNELPERVSAAYAIQTFQEGFLLHEQAYLMGLPAVPLVRLYDQAHRFITDAGGQVLLSTSAERLTYSNHRLSALQLARDQTITGDVFISAVPFDRLLKLCSPQMIQTDSRLQNLERIEVSPIIGIHLWLAVGDTPDGQQIMQLPHLILTESPLQWIFNKGIERDLSTGLVGCQHLHGVISAAYDWVDKPAEQIIDMTVSQVLKALAGQPHIARTRLAHARVVKEKRATFSATPTVDRFRPPTQGSIPNLYLAGDWCRTGWPATMEGAVRSGYLAAAHVLQDLSAAHPTLAHTLPSLVDDLPPSDLYQLLNQ